VRSPRKPLRLKFIKTHGYQAAGIVAAVRSIGPHRNGKGQQGYRQDTKGRAQEPGTVLFQLKLLLWCSLVVSSSFGENFQAGICPVMKRQMVFLKIKKTSNEGA
jgi:hypothetical protein